MANQKQGPTRPCRIFLCYRKETAQTAITFKGIMDRDSGHEYGNIWYSNLEGVGNFILDIPEMIGEAEWIIFFVGKAFTAGFLDENEINPDCVTAQELIAIEKERQKRKRESKPFHLMTVNVDGGCFDRQCVKDIKQLFLVAGILQKDSVAAYKGLNQNPYHSVSTLPHDFVEEHVAPYCALPAAPARKQTPVPTPKGKETPEPPAEKKPTPVPDIDAAEADSSSAKDQAIPVPPGMAQGLLTLANALDAVSHSLADGQKNTAELTWLANGNVLFGSYPQTAEGERRPIEWLVLKQEKDRALLISRYALDAKPYDGTMSTETWAECSLRHWLNGGRWENFLQAAFTAEERERILLTQVSADKNPEYRTDSGKSTEDKVFLLSIPEAQELFSSNEARRCVPTDYAKKQGADTNNDFKADREPTCWWLRTSGYRFRRYYTRFKNAAFVFGDGSVYTIGAFVNDDNMGLRPAMWVKL